MPALSTVEDQRNEFLARREIVCDFEGNVKKLDAIEAVTKEYSLEGKLVIPVRLQNHVGRTSTTGTFFVYEDESLAKKHVEPSVLARIEKLREAAKAKDAEAAKAAEAEAESKEAEPEEKKADAGAEAESKEAGTEDAKPEEKKADAGAEAEKPAEAGSAGPAGESK